MNWRRHFRESWPWIGLNFVLLGRIAKLYGYTALDDVSSVAFIIVMIAGTVAGLREHNKNEANLESPSPAPPAKGPKQP